MATQDSRQDEYSLIGKIRDFMNIPFTSEEGNDFEYEVFEEAYRHMERWLKDDNNYRKKVQVGYDDSEDWAEMRVKRITVGNDGKKSEKSVYGLEETNIDENEVKKFVQIIREKIGETDVSYWHIDWERPGLESY